jgi:hypothetical protein
MALLGALLAGGCMKKDIDEIRAELALQKARIDSLEAWSRTVNANITILPEIITAIEEGDYVTGVTPFMENGVQTGYTITFAKGNPIVIRHGQDGINAPVIGVKKDADDRYYWTLGGEFILDAAGNKLPVIGKDGEDGKDGTDAISPQVRINPVTDEWEISTDGGETWTATGVKATGEKGEPGEPGAPGATDAVFSGIDNSHDDYVILTLVGGGTLTLPKYRPVNISISFPQPVMFTPGETKEIPYTVTGNVKIIRVLDITDEWTITVDETNKKIIVTADEWINQRQAAGVATLLISDDDDHVIMRSLTVAVPTHPDGVLINGKIWAKYNVAEPGVFAASPADNGMLYQYNRRVGWSATDPMTSSPSGEPWNTGVYKQDGWEAVNDPCPDGWHVPSYAPGELASLWGISGQTQIIDNVECWCVGATGRTDYTIENSLCLGLKTIVRHACYNGQLLQIDRTYSAAPGISQFPCVGGGQRPGTVGHAIHWDDTGGPYSAQDISFIVPVRCVHD